MHVVDRPGNLDLRGTDAAPQIGNARQPANGKLDVTFDGLTNPFLARSLLFEFLLCQFVQLLKVFSGVRIELVELLRARKAYQLVAHNVVNRILAEWFTADRAFGQRISCLLLLDHGFVEYVEVLRRLLPHRLMAIVAAEAKQAIANDFVDGVEVIQRFTVDNARLQWIERRLLLDDPLVDHVNPRVAEFVHILLTTDSDFAIAHVKHLSPIAKWAIQDDAFSQGIKVGLRLVGANIANNCSNYHRSDHHEPMPLK